MTKGLRVWVLTTEPARRQVLENDLRAAGHIVVPVSEPADLCLADLSNGQFMPQTGKVPLVVLGELAEGTIQPLPAGVLPTAAAAQQIDAALRAAAVGLMIRTRSDDALADGFRPREETQGALLTPREIDILTVIGEGDSNKQAARRLGISAHTVKFYLEAIFQKLEATTRAEAVAKGLRQRLIEI